LGNNFNCVCNPIDFINTFQDTANSRKHITAPTESFKANGFGLYNTIGNVSEMTNTKGIAKGGNYTLHVSRCAIKSEQSYTGPASWLGFRCVCEIIDRE
jgi:formylglycine-generating enzyme required for sulfatase activity